MSKLKLGTRGSALALWQATWTKSELEKHWPGLNVELIPIKTTGDKILDVPLANIGGKGLFAKEIEEALLDGRIDLAVHSLKDLETWLPHGLVIACVLPRDDPRDVFVSATGASLAALPGSARVGTASLRRQAQLLRHRSDLMVVPIRGNVDTRLRKLEAGEFDAILVALCGLERLDLTGRATEILPREVMLPAVGQGALVIECRAGDETVRQLVGPLHDPISAACVAAERAMLAALDGSCRTPIAGLAEAADGRLTIEGRLLKPDGSDEIRGRRQGAIIDAEALGTALGR